MTKKINLIDTIHVDNTGKQDLYQLLETIKPDVIIWEGPPKESESYLDCDIFIKRLLENISSEKMKLFIPIFIKQIMLYIDYSSSAIDDYKFETNIPVIQLYNPSKDVGHIKHVQSSLETYVQFYSSLFQSYKDQIEETLESDMENFVNDKIMGIVGDTKAGVKVLDFYLADQLRDPSQVVNNQIIMGHVIDITYKLNSYDNIVYIGNFIYVIDIASAFKSPDILNKINDTEICKHYA